MSAEIEIQIIAVLTAASCAIPGVFLVLRKMSMVSDSITHTILLGIVLAFFIVNDLSSPFLLIGAAVMGPVTVWLTETLTKTRLLSEDSATGMVFPLLFSIAVILITKYAGTAHLDTDSVLLGELAFAPFDRLMINGADMGAKGIYVSGVLLLINIVFTAVFYKELLIVSFDPVLAAENLKKMLVIAVGIGGISGILGYRTAVFFQVSIAGSMACWCGIFFLGAFMYSCGVRKINKFRLKTKMQP